MSQTLPVSPPPSPPLHQSTTAKKYLSPAPVSYPQLSSCTWALEFPELQKACFLARVCEDRPPRYYQLRDVTAILQEGPTCGLTALSMLLNGTPTAGELLRIAKELRYTNNGEMFSAQNLFQLICDTLKTKKNSTTAEAISAIKPHPTTNGILATEANVNERRNVLAAAECELHQGPLDCAKVKSALQEGACIFVPYPLQK